MAQLDYKSSLGKYRRYVQAVQNQPLWKASLFLILSLSLVIILVAAALRPTLVTISSLLGQIKQQEEISDKLNRKINAISTAQQLLSQSTEKLLLLDQAIPVESRVGDWTNSVSLAASQSGIVIKSVNVSNISIKEASRSGEMKFTVVASGPYAGLKQFLQNLEGLRRLIIIGSINLTRPISAVDGTVELVIEGILGRSI